MSAPRRRREGGSRIGTLLGLALLAVPGFLLGGLAGVVWQDPGLIASYFLGRTQEVAWGVEAESVETQPGEAAEPDEPSLPAVAAPPEPRPQAAPVAPAPAAQRAAPAAQRPAPAAPPAGEGRIAVQVGAFGEKLAAERLAGTLRDKGYPAYVASGGTGAASWRVRVGPWPTREAGERAAARLKQEERLPTWVLEEER